jgi:hypothetical protein
MTTSVMPSPLIDIFNSEPISESKMAYLEARALLRLHDFILRSFEMEKDKEGLDQATVARRLGMDRGQLSRMLGVSGNWTIKSTTRLAAAIGGEVDFIWLPLPRAVDPSKGVNELMAIAQKEKAQRSGNAQPPKSDSQPGTGQPAPQ